jgi:ABC-type glycerol-3-phosphate transport system substrate-binding protein
MKKFIIITALLLALSIFAGCASSAMGTSQFFSNEVSIEKRGEETNTVWFGVFGAENYPPAERVARDNGIKRIATVERYIKVGVFGLWADYTTIVTGE